MLNLELSKVLPSRPYVFLAAFLPGFFFETSILLANPELASRLIANFQKSFPTNHYLLLGTGLFLAFVIGTGFLLLVTFIQYIYAHVYRLFRSIWGRICRSPLYPLSVWAMKHPSWRRPWLSRLSAHLSNRGLMDAADSIPVRRCWGKIASQLLKSRYGIDPTQFNEDEWPVLFWTLPTRTRWEVRGDLSMIASQATGWSGLAAILLAPTLRNGYYLTFSLFLILNGLLHDFYLIQRNLHPTAAAYTTLRATLRAFPKLSGQKPHHDAEPEENADEE
jgi:hypothetical protein